LLIAIRERPEIADAALNHAMTGEVWDWAAVRSHPGVRRWVIDMVKGQVVSSVPSLTPPSGGRTSLVFLEDTRPLQNIRQFAQAHFPSVQPFTPKEKAWFAQAMDVLRAFANSADNPNPKLRMLLADPNVLLGLLKGEPESFSKQMPDYTPGSSVESRALILAVQFSREDLVTTAFVLFNPLALSSFASVIEVVGHEIAGHLASETPASTLLTQQQRELAAFGRSIQFLEWVLKHPGETNLTIADLQDIRNVHLPREQEFLRSWGGPIPQKTQSGIQQTPALRRAA
jgi:hypothetical protein